MEAGAIGDLVVVEGELTTQRVCDQQLIIIFKDGVLRLAVGFLSSAGAGLDNSNKATGWYAEMAYFPARWSELNVRFDRLDLLDAESALGRQFNTLTMGAQVFFHPRVRLTANYVFCGVAITSPDAIVDQTVRQNALAVAATMADRVEIRLTSIF